MCQIVHLPEGVSLTEQQLSSTMTVNPDGFGWMFNDRGKIVVGKEFNKREDETFIRSKMEAHPGGVFHFRYRTRGPTDSKSCHPFNVLNKKHHGYDLWMMHNGTFQQFGNKDQTDSQSFAEKFLRPLFEMRLKAYGEEKLLDDAFISSIIREVAGSPSNVITLLGEGQSEPLIINKLGNGGKEFDGVGGKFWASNSYSFNKTHREPTGYTYQGWTPPEYNSKNKTTTYTSTGTNVTTLKTNTTLPAAPAPTLDLTATSFQKRYRLDMEMFASEILEKLTSDELLTLVRNDPNGTVLAIADMLDEIDFLRTEDEEAEAYRTVGSA